MAKNSKILNRIFPERGVSNLRGFPLTATKEDILQNEGNPEEIVKYSKGEVLMYSINIKEKVLLETSYHFGKGAKYKGCDLYVTFYGLLASSPEVEVLKKEIIEYLGSLHGEPMQEIKKQGKNIQEFYTWHLEPKSKKSHTLVLIDYSLKPRNSRITLERVLKLVQS
jgi:hypothetical protein